MRPPPVEARRGFEPRFSSAYEAFARRGETPRRASGWEEGPIWGRPPAAERREPPAEAAVWAPSPWLFAEPPRRSSVPESDSAGARDSARRFWSEAPARLARESEARLGDAAARDPEFEALAAGIEEDGPERGEARGDGGRPAVPTAEPGSIAARLTQWREELRGAPRPPAAPGGPAGGASGGGLASAAAAVAHQPILPSAAEIPLDPSRWAAATYAQAPEQTIVMEEPEAPPSLWERLIQALSGGRGKGGLLAALLGAGGGGEAQAARRAAVSGGGGRAEGGGDSAAPRAQRAERAEGEGRSSPEERRQTERARRRQEAETPLEATPTPYRLET